MLLFPAAALVFLCLLVPLFYVLVLSLNHAVTGDVALHAALTPENYVRLFSRWFYSRILVRTVWLSVLTTVLCAVFGTVLSLSLWRTAGRKRAYLILIVASPLLVSIVTRTYGWMVVLGDTGLVNAVLMHLHVISSPLHMMYTQGAVVVGLVHVFLPMMVLSVLAALDKIDPAIPEAAMSLGAGRFATFWKVIFPLAIPGLSAGITIVFSLSMSSYVTPALMGGSNAGMLTTLIYQQFVVTYNWHFGSALVMVLLATSLLVLVLLLAESSRRTRAWLTRK